ncbi:LysM peptidoglycan-binding domain-containing protein [Anaerosacchariphilus polymeriproducens]|uniref:LysM peptidoglycan-binding domain-containing protein n=1 Tax=Anaerosacchariphilus polymeriproducens TaxID=1812858 RepID=A0A371AZH1_9FIRM|nr:LysM peptidoglycan-binding domain-containing protein [Anaerosacchariphilus polymeriproducens]RDU24994.1 LysM peptidoglycan-binding domain-containing protein [Anaerosacchariphilus polymeriproducens]
MTIHVVKSGETIYSIADKYGVSADRLIIENEINNPNNLVVGEAIVILYPEITYTVQPGDTIGMIAEKHNVTVFELLRNNPYLSDQVYIYPGEEIVIRYEGNKDRRITINSYAYPFIDMDILKKTLPFLTYLTIYSYTVTAEGEINNIDDTEIIQTSKAYGVAPMMMLTAFSQSIEEEVNVVHSILWSKEKQDRFINNLLAILETKGYVGISVHTPYIMPMDRTIYGELMIKLVERLKVEGYKVFNALSIRIFQLLSGTFFPGLEYSEIAQEVDAITLISYTFGYTEGIPPGTVSMSSNKRFIERATKLIPPEKTFYGVPTMGYVWRYPYIPNVSKGLAVTYDSVLEIANINNADIKFDEITNTAYFQYITGDEYIVRFWDARSINNFVELVPEFDLKGISIWNIMNWFPQMWLVINSQYSIEKIL